MLLQGCKVYSSLPIYFPYFYLVLWKDDCQWTHGSFWKRTLNLLKDPGKYMTVSNTHSFMNSFLLNRGPPRPPPQYKRQMNDSPTPFLLHGCSYLLHSSKHFPQYLLSDKCEELLASKKQKGIRDTRMFLVKSQLSDWYRLSKDLSFSVSHRKNNFSVYVFYLSWGYL